jgi:phytoene synthase
VDEMDQALYQCIQRNSGSLTKEPFLDMIAGMKSDAVPNRRIKDMAELEEYAYQVAGTVGVMLLPLLIADVQISYPPAIAMGKSIQLINILRDASSDAALGRIYLPQDMLRSE